MTKRFLTVIMAIGMASAVLLCGSGCTAESYTEAQHIKRVTKLAEKRYLTEDSPYTSLQVFPLYTENDELGYFVIEFEPYGYVYVKIQQGTRCYIVGMYTLSSSYVDELWRRYEVEIGMDAPMTDDDGNYLGTYRNRKWVADEKGNYVNYRVSHFKAANIQNEKRYFLEIEQKANNSSDYNRGYIPAIKRGARYLNLISMEEMKYEPKIEAEKYATADGVYFPYKRDSQRTLE